MACHICGKEAVERCFTCGELFCSEHGREDCIRCETGIAPGDRRADRISSKPLKESYRPGWWRPQEAEDYEPPACHMCKGLARQVCQNCRQHYCGEHAGWGQTCKECQQTSWVGIIVFGIAMSLMVLFLFLNSAFD